MTPTPTDPLYLELPRPQRAAMEELIYRHKRARRPGTPRTLTAVVRLALDAYLRQELPGYAGLEDEDSPEKSGLKSY